MDNKIYDNKIFIYCHVCLINNQEEVTNKIENLFIFVLGDITIDNIKKIKKILKLNYKYKIKSFKKEIQ